MDQAERRDANTGSGRSGMAGAAGMDVRIRRCPLLIVLSGPSGIAGQATITRRWYTAAGVAMS